MGSGEKSSFILSSFLSFSPLPLFYSFFFFPPVGRYHFMCGISQIKMSQCLFLGCQPTGMMTMSAQWHMSGTLEIRIEWIKEQSVSSWQSCFLMGKCVTRSCRSVGSPSTQGSDHHGRETFQRLCLPQAPPSCDSQSKGMETSDLGASRATWLSLLAFCLMLWHLFWASTSREWPFLQLLVHYVTATPALCWRSAFLQ